MASAPFTGDVARLWEEVAACPEDDGARAVLADLLQVAGDPRGELISLQLLPAQDAVARQDRIQELVRDHAADWLGPLRHLVRAVRFDRGFLGALELDLKWPADSRKWERPLANRTLLTVTELPRPPSAGMYNDHGAVYARLVTSPVMAALRRIEVFDLASLVGLEGEMLAARLLPACGRRASITSFAMFADTFPLLEASRWFERLSTITVACEARRGLALWRRVPAGAALVVVSSPGIEPCTVGFPWDYRIELVQEAGRLIARIAGEWVLQPLHALAALPREVSRIEIEHTSELMARRVSEAVARPGVEVVVQAPRRAGNLRWT